MDRYHGADLGSVRGHGRKPDQVDVVELVGRGRRQALARHEQPKLGEPLGRVAIADAAEPGDEVTLGRPQRLDLEARRTVLAHERPVI